MDIGRNKPFLPYFSEDFLFYFKIVHFDEIFNDVI